MSRTLISGVRPVYPDGVDPMGWVVVCDGVFDAIGTDDCPRGSFDNVIDGCGAWMMPGLIDTHVHFREPGMTEKATVASESAAALRGGVTTVFDMPNTKPPTTTASAFLEKVALYERECLTDFKIFLGAAPGIMQELPQIASHPRFAGVKLFWGATTGSTGMPAQAELDELFDFCARHGIIIMVHAEDNDIIAANTAEAIARYGSKEAVPVEEHSRIRSSEACLSASRQAVELAVKHRTRLHLAHLTTAAEVELMKSAPDFITCETTPLYTSTTLADPANFPTRLKVNPAVKGVADAAALQEGLRTDVIDTIGTDHAPHLPADKQGGALTAASGAPWIQFALPILLETFSPELIARKMAQAPARLFGMERVGEIKPGYRADFSLVVPVENWTVTDADVVSKCGWTPAAGLTLHHRVLLTSRGKR